jgi:hypothetical protein
MAAALVVVSQARMAQQGAADRMPRTSDEMERWIRAVLSDPDEQLAVVMLPHLIARLERGVGAPVMEVTHG